MMEKSDNASRKHEAAPKGRGFRAAMASRNLSWLTALVFCSFFVVACGQGDTPSAPNVKTQAPKEAAKSAPSAVKATDEKKEEAPSAADMKNPFKPYIVKVDLRAPVVAPTTPLQKYEAEQLRLVAVMWGEGGAFAMVETPDGKGFSVRKGDLIGSRNGKVKRIEKDQVVVEERFTDASGEVSASEYALKLPLSKGEEELRETH
ncbi:MAG: pilus assembly protein PilP [Deltaproteobacteria bacterium]|nr:pilus assembly protein PilP [Deltaproteobacteria bacterium]